MVLFTFSPMVLIGHISYHIISVSLSPRFPDRRAHWIGWLSEIMNPLVTVNSSTVRSIDQLPRKDWADADVPPSEQEDRQARRV